MKNKGRLARRIIAVIVCMTLVLAALPTGVFSAFAQSEKSKSQQSPTFTILLIPKKEPETRKTDSAKPTTNGTTKVPVSTTRLTRS